MRDLCLGMRAAILTNQGCNHGFSTHTCFSRTTLRLCFARGRRRRWQCDVAAEATVKNLRQRDEGNFRRTTQHAVHRRSDWCSCHTLRKIFLATDTNILSAFFIINFAKNHTEYKVCPTSSRTQYFIWQCLCDKKITQNAFLIFIGDKFPQLSSY